MLLEKDDMAWAQETLDKVAAKLKVVTERSAGKIPYTTIDGVFDDKSGENDIGWWTNGFWGGMMWQMYTLTGEEVYKKIAEDNERKLDACLMDYEKLDHDNGFKWLPTAVANYRVTGNPASKNRGLLAAGNLAGRYNCTGFIRAWNNWPGSDEDRSGWAIIDCMMNLPLLYWASEETGDTRFAKIAVNHANTAMKHFVRGDGSANHIVSFNPVTGEMIESFGGQGYGVGSSWTRGQSWALYGFVLSYLHTKDTAYLDTAERVANYFIANTPESGLIPVDFRQPEEDVTFEDSTAAAIASCGLIELAKLKEGRQKKIYLNAALKMLHALTENSVSWKEEEDNLLTKCSASYHDNRHEFAIIYGDYYYLEALMKLAEKELFIW